MHPYLVKAYQALKITTLTILVTFGIGYILVEINVLLLIPFWIVCFIWAYRSL